MTALDYGIILGYLLLSVAISLFFNRRAGKNLESYYLGNRSMPWWLLGISMAATTFAADTPLAVTELVRTEGIYGNWLWWNMLIGHVLVGVLFARLWRRTGVLTDAAVIEQRYSGRDAAVLRGLKAVVIGIALNALTMGWVMLGMAKVAAAVLPLSEHLSPETCAVLSSLWPEFFHMPWQEGVVVIGLSVLALIYSTISGLFGVAWTDLVQFFVAVGGTVLLAVLVLNSPDGAAMWSHPAVQLRVQAWPPWGFSLPLFTWIAYLGVGWWAHKYADGGGYIVQRICAARDDRDSGRTMLMFIFLHYIVRPWPWIFVALASLVAFPELVDAQSAYPLMMLRHMPPGLLGLMVTAFLAAFMSTIDTHIHWGSSYWVHDLYARFLVKNASDRHYVTVGRLSGVLVLALAVVIAGNLRSITSAWKILYLLGAGLGPVVLARWLWWKVSAASELAAFVASLALASVLVVYDCPADYGLRLMIVSGGTALVWIPITLLFPSQPTEKLEEFFHRVRPPALGWSVFAPKDPAAHISLRAVALQWALGVFACVFFLYGIAMVMFGPRLPGAVACLLASALTLAFFRTGQKM